MWEQSCCYDDELYGQHQRRLPIYVHACLVKDGIRYGLVQTGAAQCGNNNLQALQERAADPLVPALTPKSFSYRIYPNLAQESMNFDIATEQSAKAELTILNAQGSIQKQLFYTVHEGSQSFEVKCNDWSPGLYVVRLKVNDEVKTERVVIQK